MMKGWHRAGSVLPSALKLLVSPNTGWAQNRRSQPQERCCVISHIGTELGYGDPLPWHFVVCFGDE